MAARIICWNIFNFGDSLLNKADAASRMLDVVHPIGGNRACDIFVMIEPVCQGKGVKAGHLATGSGPTGGMRILGRLRARPNGAGWRTLPPICIYSNKKKGETVLVFYHSDAVVCRGPGTAVVADAPWKASRARQGNIYWLDKTASPPVLATAELDRDRGATANLASEPEGVSYDLTHPARVYWSAPRLNLLQHAGLDGTNVTTLAAAGHSATPRALAADVAGGNVYWVDGGTGRIWKTDAVTAVTSMVGPSRASAMCVAQTRLVWLDEPSGRIFSANHDGSGAGVEVTLPGTVTQLGANGNVAYWLDTVSNDIRACDLTTHATTTLVAGAVGAQQLCGSGVFVYWVVANEIRGYSMALNTAATVVAAVHAGVPTELRATTHLFWIDGATIKRANLDGTNAGLLVAAVDAGAPQGLCSGNGNVYWRDAVSGDIRAATDAGVGPGQCVAAADAGQPNPIVAAGGRLAWVDRAAETIVVATANGANRAPISGLVGPICIVRGVPNRLFWVDRAAGAIVSSDADGNGRALAVSAATAGQPGAIAASATRVYWVDLANNDIRWANYDGSAPAVCVNSVVANHPAGLAVSTISNKVYWTDGANDIRCADLDGTNPQVFVPTASAGQPTYLTVSGGHDYLTWVDAATHDLRWAPLTDGGAASPLAGNAVVGQPGAHAVAPGDHFVPDLLSTALAGTPKWTILGAAESCPTRFRFRDVASGNDFDLVAQHAPSPSYGGSQNGKAQAGVTAVRTHLALTAARVVYVGDLNLCEMPTPLLATRPACAKSDTDGHMGDRVVLAAFSAGPPNMTLVVHAELSSLKKGAATMALYKEHAYDHVIAKGHTAVANGGIIDLVQGVINEYRVAKALGPLAPISPSAFSSASILYKIRLSGGNGISDHLPARADFTF